MGGVPKGVVMTARPIPAITGRLQRLLALALLLVPLALLAPGQALADDDPPPVDTPPIVVSGSATPSSLPSDGGNVEIKVHVIDDFPPVFMVYATVYTPYGAPQVQLYWSGDDTYTGQFYAEPNLLNDPVSYGVEVQATDSGGGYDAKLIADFTVAGVPVFDQPPLLSDPLVTPQVVPATAGNLKVGVTASDDRNVDRVLATLTKPDGSLFAYLDLNPVSYNRYEGILDVPDNTTPNVLSYHVKITGYDDIGQSTDLDAGDFTVAAAQPPGTGKLALSPAWGVLGPVRRGSAARATFSVKNTGAAGTGTVDATAAAAGTGFSIVGAPTTGKVLHLAPGQSASVVVEFRPTRAGVATGRLTVSRADGRQRALVASLSGLGY